MTVTEQQQLKWLVGFTGGCYVITQEEWQQEREKMQKQQDNSWYERGELPTVGGECEIMHRLWIKPKEVKIAAITKEYVIVVDGQCEQHYYLRDITFRPLRAEREKAIDEMGATLRNRGSAISDVILGELYDAGFRMVNP